MNYFIPMIELNDIIEPDVPVHGDTLSPWVIAVAVLLIAIFAIVIWRALATAKSRTPREVPALESARNSFAILEGQLKEPIAADSFPTLVHNWTNTCLNNASALPQPLVEELTTTRDTLSPFRFQPASRWHEHVNVDGILSQLRARLENPTCNA